MASATATTCCACQREHAGLHGKEEGPGVDVSSGDRGLHPLTAQAARMERRVTGHDYPARILPPSTRALPGAKRPRSEQLAQYGTLPSNGQAVTAAPFLRLHARHIASFRRGLFMLGYATTSDGFYGTAGPKPTGRAAEDGTVGGIDKGQGLRPSALRCLGPGPAEPA